MFQYKYFPNFNRDIVLTRNCMKTLAAHDDLNSQLPLFYYDSSELHYTFTLFRNR